MHNILAIFKNDVLALKTSVIAAIVTIGLILVPPMYAWLTTLGFWDPYANTGSIKVAVANEDEGYSSALIPTKINAGDQVISALHENDSFNWVFVSEQEAVDGAHSGEYYAAIVIPKDFTKNLMTVFSDHATKAEITYYTNEKENAIAARYRRRSYRTAGRDRPDLHENGREYRALNNEQPYRFPQRRQHHELCFAAPA